ncbi:MAG: CHAT domain-containing protein [Anaerolineae bacterium]|nr:CHAT domain-containing protein [Anaerolineae bacterium]
MNILYLYESLRMGGIDFLRSRYFVEDIEKRGHNVWLANFIVEGEVKSKSKELQNDLISLSEVSEFDPDILLIELGAFSTGNRLHSRVWLDELKLKGCIIVHCGLDYNEYNQKRKQYDEMFAGFSVGILKNKNDKQDIDELPNIRGLGWSQKSRTDVETLRKYCYIQDPKVFEKVPWVESLHALVITPLDIMGFNILITAGSQGFIKAYNDWDIHNEHNPVYGAFNDHNGIEILITGHFVTDGRERAEGETNRIFLINILEHLHTYNPMGYRNKFERTKRTTEGLKVDDEESINMTSILFLAADPTDASRLRLGEEFREIQEKLKLAKLRDHFRLELPQLSIRPADISQALLDVQPQVVHFSGHGVATGALCFENREGQIQFVQPDAIAASFEQFASQVSCVLLNACYSKAQAKAIAKHINYVIGMNQAIGDKAAIAFAIGFYQALGAGRTVEEAYKLGCVQIKLQGIPEDLTPVLVKKRQSRK